MALAPGTRLGPYEITAPLGAGGMGEVYRATDTNLKRVVAIKVLPASVAQDAERLARFQREAEVLAVLNHPNIAAIYGLERSGGMTALVMELVEGPTLADRIAQGAIRVEEALPIAKQIAEALEAAHEQGIIHRDLKPANIKVRPDGTVKVLDFGLAKAMEPAAAMSPSVSQAPTITTPAMTDVGMILGTAAYMSPEQARGKPVDRRTDIWALGAVLFEILTGKRAFVGVDVATTLASVLMKEPEWSALPPDLPTALGTYLKRCLHKDARQRVQAIGDIRLALEGAFETAPQVPRRRSWSTVAKTVGTVVITAVLMSGAISWMSSRADTLRTDEFSVRFSLYPPEGTIFAYNVAVRFAVSPDGRSIAFVAETSSATRLWLRSLDSEAVRQVAGTNGIRGSPIWSPDSRTVAFFSDGKLRRVAVAGGIPQVVSDLPAAVSTTSIVGGTWNKDGTILFATGTNQPIFRVAATGGGAQPATRLAEGVRETHGRPSFLPDGQRFLFASTGEPDRAGIWIGTLDGAAPFRILERATQAAYAQGDLLFIRDGVLVAQAFDVAVGQLTGEAQAIRGTAVGEAGQFSVSEAGVMAYASGVNPDYQFVWIDRNGRELAKVLQPARWGNFDLSPDGSRLITSKGDALTGASGNGDIWSIDLARGVETRLTFGDALDGSPLWSPDGRRIAFTRAFASPRTECHAVLMPAAGGDEVVAHDAKEGGCVILDDWSPDGRFLSFNRDPSLMALPLTGDRKPWSFVRTSSASVDESHFSPDSKWIAYSSNESGVWQVYLAPFPPKGERWQISADGGVEARWRTDARELYYLRLDGRMMAVNIRLAPTPELGEARVLFDSGVTVTVRGVNYAVSNDGQRFLMRRQVINGQLPLNVVLNWGAESESVYP